jgi:hypothetical protein
MTAAQAKKPAVSSKGKSMLASGAKGLYNFVIGDSIKTLRNPNASTFSKTLAAIDVATTVIPVGTLFKLTGKGVIKGGKAVANVFKEPIAKAAKSAKSAVTSGVSKAWGWAKGLVGKRKAEVSGKVSGTHGELTAKKVKDSHHIIQDAAVRDLPGYNRNNAPAIHLQGPNKKGTEHYTAGQVQGQSGGGTYAAERRIGYKAMRRAGVSEQQARYEIQRADQYFSSIGVNPNTPTRIPGNRR